MAKKYAFLVIALLVVGVLFLSACSKETIVTTNGGSENDDGTSVDETVSIEDIPDEVANIGNIDNEEVFTPKNPDTLTCDEVIKQAEVDFGNAKKRLAKGETVLFKAANALEAAQTSGNEADLQVAQAAFDTAFKKVGDFRKDVGRYKLVYNQVKTNVDCPAAGNGEGTTANSSKTD
ncbi:hypothetical protein HYU19_00335 [Candidatus Woesearchaeota archaeon]|nr:hypothetical protein [Candidatus Woesearchaeota archaeon]